MSRSQCSGFTLVELVLALAIIGGAFMSLLWMRTAAVGRAVDFEKTRRIQRLAQEKLDEVMYGFVTDTSGEVEELQGGEWEVEVMNIGSAESPLYSSTLTLRYLDDREEIQEYVLDSWILFPPEESVLNSLIEAQIGDMGF